MMYPTINGVLDFPKYTLYLAYLLILNFLTSLIAQGEKNKWEGKERKHRAENNSRSNMLSCLNFALYEWLLFPVC